MKKRIIGLDILRILSMCGIIGLHIIGNGGLIKNANIHSVSYYLILLVYVICFSSVDIFGILTGYLNINKETNNNRRIVELLFILLFYLIIIPIVFYSFNIENVRMYSGKELINNIFPILIGRYWYITCYIFLFFLIPYINKFCKLISRKDLKKILIILFILLTIITNIFISTDLFKISNGYSPFWLIYCYMLGAYLKLYNVDLKTSKIIKYLGIAFISQFIINCLIRNVSLILSNQITHENWFIDYISPFTLIISILLVLLFKKINIKNKNVSKIIIYFSTMSFSVYIIHSHKLIFDYVLKDLFIPILNYNSLLIVLVILLSIIGIYLACSLIDEIRIIIFKLFHINKLIDLLGEKMNKRLN